MWNDPPCELFVAMSTLDFLIDLFWDAIMPLLPWKIVMILIVLTMVALVFAR